MSADNPIVAGSRVVVVPGHVERRVGDQVFVLTPDSVMHILDNATGVHVWGALSAAGPRGATAAELAVSLIAVFAVDQEQAVEDICVFLEALRAKGVVGILD